MDHNKVVLGGGPLREDAKIVIQGLVSFWVSSDLIRAHFDLLRLFKIVRSRLHVSQYMLQPWGGGETSGPPPPPCGAVGWNVVADWCIVHPCLEPVVPHLVPGWSTHIEPHTAVLQKPSFAAAFAPRCCRTHSAMLYSGPRWFHIGFLQEIKQPHCLA